MLVEGIVLLSISIVDIWQNNWGQSKNTVIYYYIHYWSTARLTRRTA